MKMHTRGKGKILKHPRGKTRQCQWIYNCKKEMPNARDEVL
jgi:hypothetical protein